MKKIFLATLFQFFFGVLCFAQKSIDLKTLIGLPKEAALKKISGWGIKVSKEINGTVAGYSGGIKIALRNDTVSTIWVEFTRRRTGSFPYQVDTVIEPNANINTVTKHLGKPDETGKGMKIGKTKLGDWAKWKTNSYQLHCEIIDSKIVMVTIMRPNWEAGE
jgi:hypothetical protein